MPTRTDNPRADAIPTAGAPSGTRNYFQSWTRTKPRSMTKRVVSPKKLARATEPNVTTVMKSVTAEVAGA